MAQADALRGDDECEEATECDAGFLTTDPVLTVGFFEELYGADNWERGVRYLQNIHSMSDDPISAEQAREICIDLARILAGKGQ